MNTILIPHLNREPHLERCLRSIKESSQETGVMDFSVVVAGHIEESVLSRLEANYRFFQYIECETTEDVPLFPDECPPFNKSHCYNAALTAVSDGIVTFLDADAIVGKRFLLGAEVMMASDLSRLCYRVRKLPEDNEADFVRYDAHALAYEAYGNLDDPCPKHRVHPVFGNSQASVRFTGHFPLLHDEEYFGHGHEDLEWIRRFYEYCGSSYTAAIMTDPDYAMFHIEHPTAASGQSLRWVNRNERRYYGRRTLWIVDQSTKELRQHCDAITAMPRDTRVPRKYQHCEYVTTKDWEIRQHEQNPHDLVAQCPSATDLCRVFAEDAT